MELNGFKHVPAPPGTDYRGDIQLLLDAVRELGPGRVPDTTVREVRDSVAISIVMWHWAFSNSRVFRRGDTTVFMLTGSDVFGEGPWEAKYSTFSSATRASVRDSLVYIRGVFSQSGVFADQHWLDDPRRVYQVLSGKLRKVLNDNHQRHDLGHLVLSGSPPYSSDKVYLYPVRWVVDGPFFGGNAHGLPSTLVACLPHMLTAADRKRKRHILGALLSAVKCITRHVPKRFKELVGSDFAIHAMVDSHRRAAQLASPAGDSPRVRSRKEMEEDVYEAARIVREKKRAFDESVSVMWDDLYWSISLVLDTCIASALNGHVGELRRMRAFNPFWCPVTPSLDLRRRYMIDCLYFVRRHGGPAAMDTVASVVRAVIGSSSFSPDAARAINDSGSPLRSRRDALLYIKPQIPEYMWQYIARALDGGYVCTKTRTWPYVHNGVAKHHEIVDAAAQLEHVVGVGRAVARAGLYSGTSMVAKAHIRANDNIHTSDDFLSAPLVNTHGDSTAAAVFEAALVRIVVSTIQAYSEGSAMAKLMCDGDVPADYGRFRVPDDSFRPMFAGGMESSGMSWPMGRRLFVLVQRGCYVLGDGGVGEPKMLVVSRASLMAARVGSGAHPRGTPNCRLHLSGGRVELSATRNIAPGETCVLVGQQTPVLFLHTPPSPAGIVGDGGVEYKDAEEEEEEEEEDEEDNWVRCTNATRPVATPPGAAAALTTPTTDMYPVYACPGDYRRDWLVNSARLMCHSRAFLSDGVFGIVRGQVPTACGGALRRRHERDIKVKYTHVDVNIGCGKRTMEAALMCDRRHREGQFGYQQYDATDIHTRVFASGLVWVFGQMSEFGCMSFLLRIASSIPSTPHSGVPSPPWMRISGMSLKNQISRTSIDRRLRISAFGGSWHNPIDCAAGIHRSRLVGTWDGAYETKHGIRITSVENRAFYMESFCPNVKFTIQPTTGTLSFQGNACRNDVYTIYIRLLSLFGQRQFINYSSI
jgi:hypothetical protein